MLCRKPFITAGGAAYSCGNCEPCRLYRQRVWSSRLMLEAQNYADNTFATLTYSDQNLPSDGSLHPRDTQLWLKRLRKHSKLRYFIVGEYGDETQRPHYHAALFGFPSCFYGQSRYSRRTLDCCYSCDLVRDTWGLGNIYLGTLEPSSAKYICGYTVKKMTHREDPRLKGREPEFARMSLRPGIGRDAMFEVADVLMRYGLDISELDVPTTLRTGPRVVPLGRYLSKSLRTMIGRDEKTPQAALDKISAELLPLRLAARSDSQNPSLKAKILEQNQGRYLSQQTKAKIYKQRKSL